VQTPCNWLSRAIDFWLPEGEIVDWPTCSCAKSTDDAHHLDHLDVLKRAVRQAAFFKINDLPSSSRDIFNTRAPAIVEPYALTPSEFQELTDTVCATLFRSSLLDGPSHIAFILKHPEYAKLRAFPDSNYELCATNPESYQLLLGMFKICWTPTGGQIFHLSTDEPLHWHG
jgi:hypothetical protein